MSAMTKKPSCVFGATDIKSVLNKRITEGRLFGTCTSHYIIAIHQLALQVVVYFKKGFLLFYLMAKSSACTCDTS
jgi:hypothetical protein